MGATSGQGAVRLKDYTCNKILPEDKMEDLIPIYLFPVGSTVTKGQALTLHCKRLLGNNNLSIMCGLNLAELHQIFATQMAEN